LGIVFSINAISQTIVSTSPSNKNVVLEEYTGILCQYCPDGHKRAHLIQENNPDRVVLINIHQGMFANTIPDYTTQWGNALASQYQISGYPIGTVNRGTSAQDRGSWANSANNILNQSSFVNIAAKAEINVQTRELEVTVEVYYTGEAETGYNMLNVALLQNNVLGPQINMSANPDQVVGNQYNHMHMLRHLITGQWGDTLKVEEGNIPAGTFFTKTYTYSLPSNIKNIPLVYENLEVAAFIAKDKKTIYTGTAIIPQIKEGVNIASFSMSDIPCSEFVQQNLKIHNFGTDTVKTLTMETKVNGVGSLFEWEGSIAPNSSYEFEDLYSWEVQEGVYNQIEFSILSVNGNPYEGSPITTTYYKRVGGEGEITLMLRLDQYGEETTWNLKNSLGDTLYSGGPYTRGTSNRLQIEVFNLTEADCYTFTINDSYGDGINSGSGNGNYIIMDESGDTLVYSDGVFESQQTKGFGFGNYIGLSEIAQEEINLNIYPNPVKDEANININMPYNSKATIKVIDLMGREVLILNDRTLNQGENNLNINTKNLENGIYFVSIYTSKTTTTKKIIVEK
jgi:hypothetical protein